MKDNEIVGEGWIPTTDPVESADEVIESALTGAGISRTDVDAIGVTGHGRELVGKHVKAALNLEEVSVIAKGAALLSRQHKGDATVIDIGGMNNKLILMRDGIATSFNLGGICGGSSGRFLEVASNRLDVDAIGVTGHGRELVGKHVKAALNLEEVSVIAKGAALLSRQHKGDATVIDIGGMNNKLILMRDGIATSFNLGGICGGSSGRFLEVASNRLDVDISKLGELALKSKEKYELQSYCMVFGIALQLVFLF